MTTAIIKHEVTPDVWNMISTIAPTLAESRMFGVSRPAEAATVMLKGYELGLGLAAAFEFIQPIEGRPALIPRGALALILNSPHYAGIVIDDQRDDKGVPTACVVTMKRDNGLEYTVKFSMDDAKRAGIVKEKSGWEKYPANMLRWRAIGFCADVVFPDVMGGLKRADELGADLTPDGEVIEGSWTTVSPTSTGRAQPAPSTTPVDVTKELDKLIQKWGAEQVLVAGEGKIPSTLEEIQAVTIILGGVGKELENVAAS